MKIPWLRTVRSALVVGAMLPVLLVAQTPPPPQNEPGPYARIAMFHPLDGHLVDFEAAYIRHLAWHAQARDTWTWYGYTINYGDRRYYFIYATFGHAASDFDHPVDPAGDDLHNVMNIVPHVEDWRNGLYEYLPALSHGTSAAGVPSTGLRVEMTTVEIKPGTGKAFESAIAAEQSTLKGETLWYRLSVGGTSPRYLRLRPRASFAEILDAARDQALPEKANNLVERLTAETLNLRTTMSYNLAPVPQ